MKRTIRLAILALAPILLGIAFHHPEWLKGKTAAIGPDGHFYVYQMGRVAELHGMWWKLGTDDRVIAAYPTGAAKNPGLYEGLDLLILAAIVGQFLSPVATYHFAAMAAVAMNGWAASALTYRVSRSFWAAVLATIFVTVNLPTLIRLEAHEHLHLVKYSWVLLSVWCFHGYLEWPTRWRGIALGASVAATLLASFHFGYFLGVVLGTWWLGPVIRGTVRRAHFQSTLLAGVVAGLIAIAGTFPVWTSDTSPTLAKYFSKRALADVWTYSAEPWQFVTRPQTARAQDRLNASGRAAIPNESALTDAPLDQHVKSIFVRYGNASGGWNFYGFGILGGVGLFVGLRLRRYDFGVVPPAFLDRLAGLGSLLAILSLAGGPGAILYEVAPQFRCYGRAGLAALPLFAVLAAITWIAALERIRRFPLRFLAVAFLVIVVAFDWRDTTRMHGPRPEPHPPAWVPWLKDQPDDVVLAALPSSDQSYCWGETWHWQSLADSLEHRHRTLNGAEFALVYADLQLLGTGYHDLSIAGLRYIASLGVNTIAFDEAAVKRLAPELKSLSWFHRTAEIGDGWSIWTIDATAPRLATATRAELLKRILRTEMTVPAGTVICPGGRLNETIVATDRAIVEAAWFDSSGKQSGGWIRILEQTVFGPGLGAYTVRTPKLSGGWTLKFRDRKTGSILAEQPIRVSELSEQATELTSHVLVQPLGQDPLTVHIQNTSNRYLSARASEEPVPVSHPTLSGMAPGTLVLILRTRQIHGDREETLEIRRLYLSDLGPGESVDINLPGGVLLAEAKPGREIVGVLYRGTKEVPTADTPTLLLSR